MKAKIVQGGIGTYEVQYKSCWLCPWQTVYDGMFPWRGSLSDAKKIANEIRYK